MKGLVFLKISSLLNGEEIIKDIELSEIDRSQQTITVNLKVDKKNDIVNRIIKSCFGFNDEKIKPKV